MATQTSTSITDMTVEELRSLIRAVVLEALDQHETAKRKPPVDPMGLLDVPPLDLTPLPGVQLLSREEY